MKNISILALAIIAALCSPAEAQRFAGGTPGEQTFGSLNPSCSSTQVGAIAAISDSTVVMPGEIIAGSGSYHVLGVCEALPSGAYSYIVQSSYGSTPATGLNVKSLGFVDGGADNGSLVSALNTAINPTYGGGTPGAPVLFPYSPSKTISTYAFTKPLDLTTNADIKCGSGRRIGNAFPRVALVFYPGVPGIRMLNSALTQWQGGGYGTGMTIGNLDGCMVFNLGWGQTPSATPGTYGSATVGTSAMALHGDILNGANTTLTAPQFSIGDGILVYAAGNQEWNFTGHIANGSNVLNVDTAPTATIPGGRNEPGLQVGFTLVAAGVAPGTHIAGTATSGPGGTAANCGGSPCTGTGLNTGTYALDTAQSPAISTEAMTGWEMHLGPAAAVGTTISSCSVTSGNQCVYGVNNTMTLSNPVNVGRQLIYYMLPGPNTNSPAGDQSFKVSTSASGGIYGPITGSMTGSPQSTLNISSVGTATPKLGQWVMGIAGGTVTTTNSAAINLGDYNNIQVSSCTGITAGMYVVGFSGGNPIFQPGTRVVSCTPGTPNILVVSWGNESGQSGFHWGWTGSASPVATAAGDTTSGSNVIQNVPSHTLPQGALYVGMPVSGSASGVSGTIASWTVNPYPCGTYYVCYTITLGAGQNAASTLNGTSLIFGGALQAVNSTGVTLTFLNGAANIVTCPGGVCGGTGNYTLNGSGTASGASLYLYDIPAMIYVTGGPGRMIAAGEPLYSDAIPWGAIALQTIGTTPNLQTIFLGTSDEYQGVMATVTHAGGTGSMWEIPVGVFRNSQSGLNGNRIEGFPYGTVLACATGSLRPDSSCGVMIDKENFIELAIVGRFIAGNNGAGSYSFGDQFDKNYYCDICDLLPNTSDTYYSTMIQSADESTSPSPLVLGNTNTSAFHGPYMSGTQWNQSGLTYNSRMIGTPTIAHPFPIYGSTWTQYPRDAVFK